MTGAGGAGRSGVTGRDDSTGGSTSIAELAGSAAGGAGAGAADSGAVGSADSAVVGSVVVGWTLEGSTPASEVGACAGAASVAIGPAAATDGTDGPPGGSTDPVPDPVSDPDPVPDLAAEAGADRG